MTQIRLVYVDMHRTTDDGRLLLTSAGTQDDLSFHGMTLAEGEAWWLWSDDEDSGGNFDPFVFSAQIEFDRKAQSWVASYSAENLLHYSDYSIEDRARFAPELRRIQKL